MNNYVNSSNYYIQSDIGMLIKNRSKRNINSSSNKSNQHISLNYTFNRNRNYNRNRPNTNYYMLNKNRKEITNLKNYNSTQHAHYYNNENFNNDNNMASIITIKKSFERLKNKINSLQKIVNNNNNYNYIKEIKPGYKSSDKISNSNKNIYNNIYINIDNNNKDIKYDNYMLSNNINNPINYNGRNTVMKNVKNYQNYNYMNLQQNHSNYDLKKYNSSNNLILPNAKEKNKSKYKFNINNNNEPLFKYSNFNNYKSIKVNINNKTTSESENISEIANNLILISKFNKNSLKNEYSNHHKEYYTYNGIQDMNDLKADYDTLNDRNNIISVNKNKELYKNNNNRLIMKQSKENDILLNPTVLKVDEGTSIRISITTSNNNENDLIFKSKEVSPLKIMKNEIITFTNEKKNLNKKKENKMKLLYSNFKISNEISICYNIPKKDKIKNEEIIKLDSKIKNININNHKNDKKELSKSKEINIKISNNNTKVNINKNNNDNTNINTDNSNNNKKINTNKNQIDKKIKINQNRNNKNIKKNNLILNTKKAPNTISYKSDKQIRHKTEKTETHNIHQKSIQHKKEYPKKDLLSNKMANSTILQKSKPKIIRSNKIPKHTINSTINNTNLKNKNPKKSNQNKSKKKTNTNTSKKNQKNNRSRKESITSQDERDDILINQIITETESKQKQKKNLHIQIKLENNTYIKYIQDDFIKNSIYINSKSEPITKRKFNDLIYNEILKSKCNLIPIIKKNFNVKNFKINKEYKLNENLEEKEIIPELYQEYSNDDDFKLLEKTLERSIEKTFKRKYGKNEDKNNLSLSLSDNKNKNKDKDKYKNKNEIQNTFSKIRDMFNQEEESEFESSEKSDENDNEYDESKSESENESKNVNDDNDEGSYDNEDAVGNENEVSDNENNNEYDEENESEEEQEN